MDNNIVLDGRSHSMGNDHSKPFDDSHQQEVKGGDRYRFGNNWERFLKFINPVRIQEAVESVRGLLHVKDLDGKSFLDIGSGSGLFSLSAMNLNAKQVFSFDYDPQSVGCTAELKRRYHSNSNNWHVERGNVLDKTYMESLGKFDVVYSWGVLHHTGNMWLALENAANAVAPGGKLYIAIYNKQPFWSTYWTFVKRSYNKLPKILKLFVLSFYTGWFMCAQFAADVLRGINPMDRHRGLGKRGMTVMMDITDWVGGYPFEVASPEEIFRFFRDRGFNLIELITVAGKLGCNEFVFEKKL